MSNWIFLKIMHTLYSCWSVMDLYTYMGVFKSNAPFFVFCPFAHLRQLLLSSFISIWVLPVLPCAFQASALISIWHITFSHLCTPSMWAFIFMFLSHPYSPKKWLKHLLPQQCFHAQMEVVSSFLRGSKLQCANVNTLWSSLEQSYQAPSLGIWWNDSDACNPYFKNKSPSLRLLSAPTVFLFHITAPWRKKCLLNSIFSSYYLVIPKSLSYSWEKEKQMLKKLSS